MSTINVDIVDPQSGTSVTVSGVAIDAPGATNISIGDASTMPLVSGGSNIGIGFNSLVSLTSGTGNLGIGESTGLNVDTSSLNTFLGHSAGSAINASSTGNNNTAIGALAGYDVLGSDNTLLGYNAGGMNSVSGSNNILIGFQSTTAALNSNNSITLGNSSNTVLRCAVTSITSLSDARDKKDVKELGAGLNFVKGLKPVEFVWDDRNEEGKHDIKDFGFIAQDLKKSQDDAELAETLKLVYEENPEKLEASYGKLIPILVKAIQDLSAKVEALEAK
jgi:trimeric autotransporter adhesin